MNGVFGVDPQLSRTVIALAQGAGRDAHTRPVGDGRRMLVPNACRAGGAWGSPAVEEALGQAAEGVELRSLIDGWRCDPLGEGFLRGVHDRLFSYLGRTPPTGRYGYQVCVAAPAARHGAAYAVRPRFAATGLTDVAIVNATDALVCRWLADPTTPAELRGNVLAVACGEAVTSVAAYTVERTEEGTRVVARTSVPEQTEPATATIGHVLAAAVLDRCSEGVRPDQMLAVLDSTWEFGTSLRSRGPDEELEWNGALADRMFAPLVLTRGRLAGWPAVLGVNAAVTAAARRVVSSPPRQVLVGGLGAVWPFTADVLGEVGPVWRSSTPEYDVAYGSAWWPLMRSGFSRAAGPGGALVPPPRREAPTGDRTVRSTQRPVTSPASPARGEPTPPWERDE